MYNGQETHQSGAAGSALPPPPFGFEIPLSDEGQGNSLESKKNNAQRNITQNFVEEKGFKDLWAALLFLAVQIAVGILAFKFAKPLSNDFHPGLIFSVMISICVSIIIGLLSILFMKLAPKVFIGTTLFSFIVLQIGLGAFFLIQKKWMGLVFIFFAVIIAAWWCFSAKKIRLTVHLLKYALKVLVEYPAALLSGLFSTGSFCAACYLVSSIYAGLEKNKNEGLIILLFLFFWVYFCFTVIKNVVHVTVSGVIGSHYFRGPNQPMASSPTLNSAKRALTTSFGSICFGSLIITIITIIRVLVETCECSDNIVCSMIRAILLCLISFIEDIIKFISKYAFIHVALFGKDFCSSVKDTKRVIEDSSMDIILGDCVIGVSLFIASIAGSIISGIITMLILNFTGTSSDYQFFPVVVIFTFLIYWSLYVSIDSGVSCSLICVAHDASILESAHPELFEEIRGTYPDVLSAQAV